MYRSIRERIDRHAATVTVMGQGYVGLPLALRLAEVGFRTFGFDTDSTRASALQQGHSYVVDVPDKRVRMALSSGYYTPTSDASVLRLSDVIIICVPTPLRKSREPDLSYVVGAVEMVKEHLRPPQLVILESTTYPGTTNEIVVGRLEESGYRVGQDYFVCFSPERVDPGNKQYGIHNTPKVVGGVTPACTDLGAAVYRHVANEVITVSSARAAEMVKLLENTFRAVNIGLVNELALMAERMGIDIWEVIDAAATKPFGFMPFYPGPGIGGHCIPLDPVYLSWKAKQYGFYNKFIGLATGINANMPRHVVAKVSEALNLIGRAPHGASVLVLGVAYKRDVDDVRESPGVEVFHLLEAQGAHVDFSDPLVESIRTPDGRSVRRVDLTDERLRSYDCVVLTTDHTAFDYHWIARHARLIVDTRNAFRGINAPHIIRLGAPTPHPAEWQARMALRVSVDGQ
ncbi:nucleotide sugar dehydrogenase [Geochorda subterranea]|uniref:Nucleotide sugar dehydrogenase n=1 Tax=Geochorda subterranea TaxID=3109564 RepID=A0ABZ1BLT1_9FIRM|nr:nucleotide sugar dehydrogenase [Limnochorda sp. LNt]WRP13727.1 nucleotide sugar dehydrogenase [Limnochorda sp. LNt]